MQTVKDHIKSDILQSAATLFLEKGYLKVPMREIAHKSGGRIEQYIQLLFLARTTSLSKS